MGKAFLGIDYGRKRIGIAISESGLLTRPLKTIENKGTQKNLTTFTQIVKEYNIGVIVIGLPLHRNTMMSNEVRAFAKTLEPLNVAIVFQNEMLTSVEAEEVLTTPSLRATPSIQRGVISVDSIAAAMILQDYLKGEK